MTIDFFFLNHRELDSQIYAATGLLDIVFQLVSHNQSERHMLIDSASPSNISECISVPQTCTNSALSSPMKTVSFFLPFHHSNTTSPSASAITFGFIQTRPKSATSRKSRTIQCSACATASGLGASES